MWVTITYAHGEFVHTSCMLDRAEHVCVGTQTRGHAFCVALKGRQEAGLPTRQNWPRICPHHGRGEGDRGALQFAELLEEDSPRLVPASYVTTGSNPTFEHMVRTHGRNQISSVLPASAGLLPFPPHKGMGSGRRPLPGAFRRVRHQTTGHLSPAPKAEALHGISRPRVPGKTLRRMRGTPYQVDPRGPICVSRQVMRRLLFRRRRQTRWTRWVQGWRANR